MMSNHAFTFSLNKSRKSTRGDFFFKKTHDGKMSCQTVQEACWLCCTCSTTWSDKGSHEDTQQPHCNNCQYEEQRKGKKTSCIGNGAFWWVAGAQEWYLHDKGSHLWELLGKHWDPRVQERMKDRELNYHPSLHEAQNDKNLHIISSQQETWRTKCWLFEGFQCSSELFSAEVRCSISVWINM